MNKDIEKQLENYKYDKQSIPVLVYKVENIELKGNRYFKVFLVNNSKVYENLEIAFKINNHTYIVSSFSIIKEYKDPNIFGCVIKLEEDYKGVDYDILYELKDGKKFIPTTPKKVETPKEEPKKESINVRNFETKIEKKEEKPKKVKKKNKSSREGNKVLAILGIFVIVASLLCICLMKVGEEKQRKLREEIEEIEEIREEARNIINWYGKYDEALVKYEEAFEKEKVLLNGQEIMSPNDFEKELNKINDPIEAYNFCITNNYVEIAKKYVEDCIAEYNLFHNIDIKNSYEKLYNNKHYEFISNFTSQYLETLKIGDTMYFGSPNNLNPWTVLDIEDTWTVLDIKDNSILVINNDFFAPMKYSDSNSSKWKNSLIYSFLEDYWTNNFTSYEKQLIKETQLDGASNHLFILNEHEFNKYRDIIPVNNYSWWLRPIKEYDEYCLSMGSSGAYTSTSYVLPDMNENKNYTCIEEYGYGGLIWVEHEESVKPAMWIDIKSEH